MCVIVLQWKCSLAISKWRKVKTWTTHNTFFYVFFWHDTSKKRRGLKSRVFLDFQKNVKNVYSNYGLAVSATVFEILTLKAGKSLNFHNLPFLRPPSGWTPLDIDVNYTPLKSAFNALQFRRWHNRCIFLRLAVVASQSREITRNSDKIWPYSSSRSSKVIDLGVNRKPMYDFPLVTNCNFGRICYRFRDIDA